MRVRYARFYTKLTIMFNKIKNRICVEKKREVCFHLRLTSQSLGHRILAE